jgi:phage shock protein A
VKVIFSRFKDLSSNKINEKIEKGGDVRHRQHLEKTKKKLEVVQFPMAKVGTTQKKM